MTDRQQQQQQQHGQASEQYRPTAPSHANGIRPPNPGVAGPLRQQAPKISFPTPPGQPIRPSIGRPAKPDGVANHTGIRPPFPKPPDQSGQYPVPRPAGPPIRPGNGPPAKRPGSAPTIPANSLAGLGVGLQPAMRPIPPIRTRPDGKGFPQGPAVSAGIPQGVSPHIQTTSTSQAGQYLHPQAAYSAQGSGQLAGVSTSGRPAPAGTAPPMLFTGGQSSGVRPSAPGSGVQLRVPAPFPIGQGRPAAAEVPGQQAPFRPQPFLGRPPPIVTNRPPGPQHGAPSNQLQPPHPSQAFTRRAESEERINPDSMPRPRPRPEEPEVWPSRTEGRPQLPLPAEWPVIVQDRGNCSPRNMRMTFSSIPGTSDLIKQAKMPFAVLVQPLAPMHPEEEPLQVVDMGPEGPLRCSKCRAYVNPFMQFHSYGKSFTCNFCSAVTAVPPEYQENIGPDGRRRDADERPELCRGSIEFVAPPSFSVREPMPPTHFFLIDVSHTAVTTGVTTAACASIQRILDDIQGQDRAQVGFATFDNQIQFYSLRPGQSQPQMLVIPDADEPYCPLPQLVGASLLECRSLAEGLLDQIPRIYQGTNHLDCCATAAIEACILALKGGHGGKLHVFLSSLPKVGSKALAVRDLGGKASEKEPMRNMAPASVEYRQMAEAAAESMVSIDLFCLTQTYVDVATLGILTYITSGQLYLYQPFKQDTHGDEFFNDLRWNIVRPQGWEAVGRLRTSDGIVVERYYGPHYRRTMTDVDLPAVNADSSLAIELRHSEQLPESREAYLQFALLFTNCEGQRRVRVHTIGIHVTNLLSTVFRGADLDSQVNFIARSVAYQMPGGKLEALKEHIYKSTVDILFAYREKVARSAASGQLILPESLKLLPLYALALTKNSALRGSTKADIRAASVLRLLSLTPERTLPLIYPRLFALGSLLTSLPPDANLTELQLPESISRLSAAKLSEDGIFLLENGYEAFIHFGPRVASELMMALLGLPTLEVGSQHLYSLPEFDTHQSRALHALMDIVRRQRGRFIPLQAVPHAPAYMSPFYSSLVEDQVEGMSYMDYLRAIHRAISSRLK